MLDDNRTLNISSMAVATKLLRIDIVVLLILHLLSVLEVLLLLGMLNLLCLLSSRVDLLLYVYIIL